MSAPDRDVLVDRADIHDLLVRLVLAQDARDWDGLAACFDPDASYTHPGGVLAGVDAIVERSRNALAPLDASQHLLGSILVDVDGDEATAVSYFQAQHIRTGLDAGERYAIAGTYRDRLVRSGGGWRIAQRTQEYTWREGNPEVIRRGPSASRPA